MRPGSASGPSVARSSGWSLDSGDAFGAGVSDWAFVTDGAFRTRLTRRSFIADRAFRAGIANWAFVSLNTSLSFRPGRSGVSWLIQVDPLPIAWVLVAKDAHQRTPHAHQLTYVPVALDRSTTMTMFTVSWVSMATLETVEPMTEEAPVQMASGLEA